MMTTPSAEELDKNLDEFIEKIYEDKDKLPKGQLDDAFWKVRRSSLSFDQTNPSILLLHVDQDLERHPFFLKEIPEEGAELHPATEALQALKWEDEDDTPLGSSVL